MTFLPQSQVRRWTLTAAQCYQIGCNCEKCYLPQILETKCLMKKTVIKLVKEFGAPDIEKIKQEQQQGYTKY